jgi:hypothetical protein
VQGFPVHLAQLPGKGRGMIASKDLEAGEFVMRAEKMGHAVRVRSKITISSNKYAAPISPSSLSEKHYTLFTLVGRILSESN